MNASSVASALEKELAVAKVEMYLRPTCWYCKSARRLLDEKGVDYQVIDINEEPDRREEMLKRGRGTTVPQILIDGVAIGGFDELSELDEQGKLDAVLL